MTLKPMSSSVELGAQLGLDDAAKQGHAELELADPDHARAPGFWCQGDEAKYVADQRRAYLDDVILHQRWPLEADDIFP